jgi:hypothetical protein
LPGNLPDSRLTITLHPCADPAYDLHYEPDRFPRRRFYFFSREEPRMHVHIQGQNGEAKFWLEPVIQLAQHTGLGKRELGEALRIVQEHEHDIRSAWRKHFPG